MRKTNTVLNPTTLSNWKSVLVTLSLLLITKQGTCQKVYGQRNENIGIATSSMICADGYGTQYSPMLYYKKDRKSYFVGPLIQKQKLNVSGLQFSCEYAITGNDVPDNDVSDDYNDIPSDEKNFSNVELFCFINAIYQNNALLGKATLRDERMANTNKDIDFCKLHFKSVEVYTGFGLKIKLFKNFKWINCIGLGGYKSFDFPDHLYYNGSNIGLLLKTGISYDFKK